MCPDLAASQSDFSFRAGDLTPHDLGVVAFEAEEGISQLFRVRLDLASDNREIDLNEIVGKPALLGIAHPDPDLTRYFNGIVSRMEFTGEGVSAARYECEVVPFIWLLGLRQKCRIFQEMTVPDIIKQVLKDAGLPNDMLRTALTRTYPKREYCVQYRETELNFIQRLMEEEGIFYFFEHTKEKHILVMGDNKSAHQSVAGEAQVIYREPTAMVQGEEFVSHFRFGQQVRHGAVMMRDFEFQQPKLNLEVEKKAERDPTLEWYDYPGEYKEPGVGTALAQVRLEEFQTERLTARARSVCRRFIPGYKFQLAEHQREDLNQEYLITHVQHRATQPQMLQEEPAATVEEGPLYENNIVAIPSGVPFRPSRITPRPVVQGTQTAIVVGPQGEEIHTDKHGRVKVKFPWDREGKFDDKASCWIRVNQAWAGGKYGVMMLPRIGHEVIVDFLEGDPDQPIIVGRVYNGDEQPPYGLPNDKTKSTIKTANSKGQDGAHEIRFEDKKDEEQIFIHSQKDLHIRALNDRVTTIGASSHESIGGDSNEKIGKKHSMKVCEDQMLLIEGKQSLKVAGDMIEQVGGAFKKKVSGNVFLEANQVVIKATAGISLVCGGNHVTVDMGGVTIVGTLVKINSGGAALSDASGSPVAPTAPAEADKVSPGKDTTYTGESREQEAIPTEELEPLSWIGVELKDEEGNPIPGEACIIRTDDGREIHVTLDSQGQARVENIKPGTCMINFPNRREWRRG